MCIRDRSNTVILRVLRNEKYCGDLIQKKTITPNYLNHEKKYNRGEEEFVVLRDHHEPIISRELFNKAQRELARRSPSDDQKAKYSNRYCFSGKIKCGICGCSYVSRTKKRRDGSTYKAWRCYQSANHGSRKIDKAGNEIGCDNRSLSEDDLRLVLRQVVKNLLMDKETIIENLSRIVQSALQMDRQDGRPEKLEEKLRLIGEKRQSLLELYLGKDITKEDFRRMAAKYDAEAAGLETEQKALAQRRAQAVRQDELLKQAVDTIKGLATGEEWDDAFYRHILGKITVLPGNVLEVSLGLLPQSWRYLVADERTLQKGWASAPPERRDAITAALRGQICGNTGATEGTEELGHFEMICAIIYQLTRNLSVADLKKGGFDAYYIDHTTGLYPVDASGNPFSAKTFQSTGDVIADLTEDLAAEQKARLTYDNILRLVDDPEVRDPIKFLREREVVHFQRFGEGLRLEQEQLDSRNFYAFNPEFDKRQPK